MSPHHGPASRVEFIGGPYDGLVEALDAPLQPFLALKVPHDKAMEGLKRRLLSLFRFRPAVAVHMSIYELSRDGRRFRYHYCGTQAIGQGDLANKPGLGTMDHPPCGV